MQRVPRLMLPIVLALALVLSTCGGRSKPTDVSRIRSTPPPTSDTPAEPVAPADTPREEEEPAEAEQPAAEEQPAEPEPTNEDSSEEHSMQPEPSDAEVEEATTAWSSKDTETLNEGWEADSAWTPFHVLPLYLRLAVPSCDEAPPAGLGLPAVAGHMGFGSFAALCLYGFDLQEHITIQLHDPAGALVSTGSFQIMPGEDGSDVVYQHAPVPVLSPIVGSADLGGSTSRARISLWLPVGVMLGTWRAQVNVGDETAEGHIEVMQREVSSISILHAGTIDPFQRRYCPSLSTGDEVEARGAGFETHIDLTLGLYHTRMADGLAGLPVWGAQLHLLATQSVTVDDRGEFQTPLPVLWSDPGSYLILASTYDPSKAFKILGPLDPRVGCFTLPSAGILTLDNFEGYGTDAALQSAFGINDAWGENQAWLELAAPPHVAGGQRAAGFRFVIQKDPPNDYAGFERIFPAQDWRGYTNMHLWVKSDSDALELVVQFRESGGEAWRHRQWLAKDSPRELDLPLNERTFEWADWSPQGNGRIDLEAVDYIGFFIGEAGQTSGTLYVDEIELR
jgi:hypothetical protein